MKILVALLFFPLVLAVSCQAPVTSSGTSGLPQTLKLDPPPGTYGQPPVVTVSADPALGPIYYQLTPLAKTVPLSPVLLTGGLTIPVVEPSVLKVFQMVDNSYFPAAGGTYRNTEAASPTISPVPGTFSSPQLVTLSTVSPGATVKYTLDGAEPTELSLNYSGPFTVAATKTVKARSFVPGLAGSPVRSWDFEVPSQGSLGSLALGAMLPTGLFNQPLYRDGLVLTRDALFRVLPGGALEYLRSESRGSDSWAWSGNVLVSGKTKYVSGNNTTYSLEVETGSGFDTLVSRASVSAPGRVWDVTFSGSLVYVAFQEFGLRVYDLTDPGSPRDVTPAALAFASLPYVDHVEIGAGVLSVLAKEPTDTTVKLITYTLADPSAPVRAGTLTTLYGGVGFWDMKLVGRNLLITGNQGQYASNLYMVGISDPKAPVLRSNLVIGSLTYDPLAILNAGIWDPDYPVAALPHTQGHRIGLYAVQTPSADPAQDKLVLVETLNPRATRSQVCATPEGLLTRSRDAVFTYRKDHTAVSGGFRLPSASRFSGTATALTLAGTGLVLNGHLYQSGRTGFASGAWEEVFPGTESNMGYAVWANNYLYYSGVLYTQPDGTTEPTYKTDLRVVKTDAAGKPVEWPAYTPLTTTVLPALDKRLMLRNKLLDVTDPAQPKLVSNFGGVDGTAILGEWGAAATTGTSGTVGIYSLIAGSAPTKVYTINAPYAWGSPLFYTTETGAVRLVIITETNLGVVTLWLYSIPAVGSGTQPALLASYVSNAVAHAETGNTYSHLLKVGDQIVWSHRDGTEILKLPVPPEAGGSLTLVNSFPVSPVEAAWDASASKLFLAAPVEGFFEAH